MLERYHLVPDEVDELDEEFILELDAKAWAASQQQQVQKQRDAMRARMAARGGRHR